MPDFNKWTHAFTNGSEINWNGCSILTLETTVSCFPKYSNAIINVAGSYTLRSCKLFAWQNLRTKKDDEIINPIVRYDIGPTV